MKTVTASFGFDDMVVGHARVDDVDVAYVQCPNGKDRYMHWYFGADDSGAVMASGIGFGPIVPGRADASGPEIAALIVRGRTERKESQESFGVAATVGFGFEKGLSHMALMAKTYGLRNEEVALADAAIRAAIGPVRRRLGRTRLDLGHHYLEAQQRRSLSTVPRLDRDEALTRILRLTERETQGLARFFHHPLLKEIVEAPELRLDRPEEEIIADLHEIVGIPEAAVRRLPPGTWVDFATVKALRSLPIDWIPAPDDHDGWKDMKAIVSALNRAGVTTDRWRTLCDPCKGDWPAFHARCMRAIGQPEVEADYGDHHDALDTAVTGAGDLGRGFTAFLSSIGETTMAGAISANDHGFEATWGSRGLPAVLEASRDWHERFSPPAMAGVTWKPILPRWTHPGTGIEVVPLTGSNALAEEGEAMDHCVGGETFALGSLRDRIRVVSLRKDGERVSTGEIALGGRHAAEIANGGIVQHYARRNAKPSREAGIALMSYVATDAVRTARMDARDNSKALPAHSRADQEALLERWRSYLTGDWRNLSLDTMRARIEPEMVVIGTTRRAQSGGRDHEGDRQDAGPTPFG